MKTKETLAVVCSRCSKILYDSPLYLDRWYRRFKYGFCFKCNRTIEVYHVKLTFKPKHVDPYLKLKLSSRRKPGFP